MPAGFSRQIHLRMNYSGSAVSNCCAVLMKPLFIRTGIRFETAEYRYLLARNSWFYGFTDFGWAAYNVNDVKFSHTYLGFGVGLSLETNTGIFSISLAEGKRNDLKLNFQQSKIHLGFISLF
jgi:hemolysin activation/secretion protein